MTDRLPAEKCLKCGVLRIALPGAHAPRFIEINGRHVLVDCLRKPITQHQPKEK